jgi:hypothetical protein
MGLNWSEEIENPDIVKASHYNEFENAITELENNLCNNHNSSVDSSDYLNYEYAQYNTYKADNYGTVNNDTDCTGQYVNEKTSEYNLHCDPHNDSADGLDNSTYYEGVDVEADGVVYDTDFEYNYTSDLGEYDNIIEGSHYEGDKSTNYPGDDSSYESGVDDGHDSGYVVDENSGYRNDANGMIYSGVDGGYDGNNYVSENTGANISAFIGNELTVYSNDNGWHACYCHDMLN